MSENILLEMTGISKFFPGVRALENVDLDVISGEVHALLGENGAGKSTLIKVLGGIYAADAGEIKIDGQPVIINTVKDAQQNGIAIIHQELVLVPQMSVAENIFLGREFGAGILVNRDEMIKQAQVLLNDFDININASTPVAHLTIAQQQMVEIIKAISQDSKILVMDEPTSSISDREVEFLFSTIRALTARGVGIIYISHKMAEIEEICDRVTILRDGIKVSTEIAREVTRDILIAKMVGRELVNYYTRDYLEPGEVVLECKNVSDGHLVEDVSFQLRRSEIIGFAGLIGAGRSELVKCIFGLNKTFSGDIYINGEKANIKSPVNAINSGIALVPEDRRLEGLFAVQSVRFNSTISILSDFITGIRVDRKKEERITQEYIDKMSTRTPSQNQHVNKLSGGNQQKVMIGRWLATRPRILILDEPTRGVDVGAKSEIYAIMNDLVKEGVSIIMISSELPEIINMSDRVYVMRDGLIAGELSHTEANQEKIMELATR